MTNADDAIFMKRALALAEHGLGFVSPNPLVGAVVVKNERIIGEGYHARYGESHAEAAALEDARARGEDPRGATLYITLEPCNHTGHQPPCVEAIIKAGIGKVVYAIANPNPAVRGGGARVLEKSGIEIAGGVLSAEAREQNKIWLYWITAKTPYVCIKVAATLDNKITKKIGAATQISCPESQQFSHTLRQQFDAILVGEGTVAIDNPALTTRLAGLPIPPHQPLRVIVDGRLTISPAARVLNDAHCLVLTTSAAHPTALSAIKKKAAVAIVPGTNGRIASADILRELSKRFITSILIEGGQQILTDFFADGPVNEWIIIRSPLTFGEGLDFIAGPDQFTKKFSQQKTVPAGRDTIEFYSPRL